MDINDNTSLANGVNTKSRSPGVTSNGHSHHNGAAHTNGIANGHAISPRRYSSLPHPFVYSLHPTRRDKLIWVLMTVTLIAPLKLLISMLLFCLAWIPARLAVMGLPLQPDKPFTKWRIVLKNMTAFLVRCGCFTIGIMSQTVKGKQASSKEAPVIVIAPHMSHADSLAGAICGLPGVVSVLANAKIPIFGTIFRVNQSIFVQRGDPDSRSKAAKAIKERAESKGAWPQLMVYPEGMCANQSFLLPFKLGAFLPGVSVQPVTVRYNNRLDVTTWLDTGPHLVAMMSLLAVTPKTSIEVEFHPVYHPSVEEKEDPQLFANNVRDLMSRYLNVAKTELEHRDLIKLVKRSEPDRSFINFWRNIITKGYVEMPEKEHLS